MKVYVKTKIKFYNKSLFTVELIAFRLDIAAGFYPLETA